MWEELFKSEMEVTPTNKEKGYAMPFGRIPKATYFIAFKNSKGLEFKNCDGNIWQIRKSYYKVSNEVNEKLKEFFKAYDTFTNDDKVDIY